MNYARQRGSVIVAVAANCSTSAPHCPAGCDNMVAVSVTLLTLYAWVAPGAAQSTSTSVLFAFVFGQLFLVARLIVRLSLYGGELELYRTFGRRPDIEPRPPAAAPSTP